MTEFHKMAVLICQDSIVMDMNCHNDMRIAMDNWRTVMLTIWGDTVLHSNAVGNWEDRLLNNYQDSQLKAPLIFCSKTTDKEEGNSHYMGMGMIVETVPGAG